MRRRSFLQSLVSAVAAAALEVCGSEAETPSIVIPPNTVKYTCKEEIGITIANVKAINKVSFV